MAKELLVGFGGRKSRRPPRARRVFILYVASAGVRLQNNEPIGQFLREVAKTK